MTADVLPSPEQGGVRSGSFTVHNLVNGEINKSQLDPPVSTYCNKPQAANRIVCNRVDVCCRPVI